MKAQAQVLWCILLCLSPLVTAQFDFFNMFGHGQHQHQQQRGSGPSQWASQADSISCNTYLCPDTLLCVSKPADCPCPSPEDLKCLVRDAIDKHSATVVCVRGSEGCAQIDRLASKWK